MALPQNDPKAPPVGQPHTVNWFYRLFGLYDRQSHPFDFDTDQQNEDAAAKKTAEWWSDQFKLGQDRKERYRIFDEMDASGLAGAILDLFAEETTQIDYEKGRAVWIESKSNEMIKRGDECLRNLMVEDKLFAIVRGMCKYGDHFRRLIYSAKKGVLGWQQAPVDKTHRLDDRYGRLIGFREDGKTFRGARKRPVSWPWDYVHFRMMGKDENTGYGTSILEPMFNPWRRLMLADDAVLMYRLRRAPDRNMVLVDVGNMEEHEALEYVNAWRKRFRKHEFVDPASPNYRKQYNPLTPLEDFFIPIRGGENNSRVENLSGSSNADQLFDLNYYRDTFFGAGKVPKAYMGFEGDVNAKATLIQQDVRFARTCKRARKHALYGLRQTLDIHYTLLADSETDTKYDFSRPENKYLIQMTPISYLDEFERLELIQLRYQIVEAMANVATSMQIDVRVWATYILLEYAKLPEDLVMKLIAKTPEGPLAPGGMMPPGGAPGEEPAFPPEGGSANAGVPPAEAARFKRPIWMQITENMGKRGFYPLSEAEKTQIARLMHESCALRKVVGDITEYHIDDLMNFQTDPSLLPVISKGAELTDVVNEDTEVILLREDLAALKSATLNEEKKK